MNRLSLVAFGTLAVPAAFWGHLAASLPSRFQDLSGTGSAMAPKIAFVNAGEVFGEHGSREWNDSVERLKKDGRERYEKISADEQRLRKLMEELSSRQSKWTSETARQAKTEEAMRLENDIKIAARMLDESQARAMQELQVTVGKKLGEAASQVATQDGWDVIEIAMNVLYLKPAFDVTKKVIKLLNDGYEAQQKKGKLEGQKK